VVKVSPSQLAYQVHVMRERRRDLPTPIVAAIGNSLISRQGVDYEFDVQAFLKEERLMPSSGDESGYARYKLPLKTVEGEPLELDVEVSPAEACGERLALLPLSRLTKLEMEVVSGGVTYRLRRPASFGLESMSLVDSAMNKKLRTWELPFVTKPSGISPDGKTVYFPLDLSMYRSPTGVEAPIWQELPPPTSSATGYSELILATSSGVYSFADASLVPAGEKSEGIKNAPVDQNDAYARFQRFQLHDRVFIIRFEGPCT